MKAEEMLNAAEAEVEKIKEARDGMRDIFAAFEVKEKHGEF